MKVEEVKQITNKALEELAASLESGQSQALTAYLKTMALFSKYSLNNLFLIARQRPDARRVAGYQTWRKVGLGFTLPKESNEPLLDKSGQVFAVETEEEVLA